jgi:hypothetical protein
LLERPRFESIITHSSHSLISSSSEACHFFLLPLLSSQSLCLSLNMHFPYLLASRLALISSGVLAAPSAQTHKLGKRCENSASDRSCWGDYDLSTDYYTEVPDTGVTVEVSRSRFLNVSTFLRHSELHNSGSSITNCLTVLVRTYQHNSRA